VILSIKNLTTSFQGRVVHNNISIDFPENKITLIMGGSGAGKSTLLDFIINPEDRDCYAGELLWNGKPWDRSDIAYKIGYAPQLGGFLLDKTVAENISMPVEYVLGIDPYTALEMAWSYMQLIGLGPEVFKMFPNMLSGGMLRRASIARALILDQEVIILDEPLSGLDPINCRMLVQVIKKLAVNRTIIIITHHLIQADYYLILNKGRSVQGDIQTIMKDEMGREFIESFQEV
jgi:phospholipid/cholesterol/gamma-HCH transport system ATP-binding protein